jgi:hypothetical protein
MHQFPVHTEHKKHYIFTCNKHNKDTPVPCAHRTQKTLHIHIKQTQQRNTSSLWTRNTQNITFSHVTNTIKIHQFPVNTEHTKHYIFTLNKHNKDTPVHCAHRTHKTLHLLHTPLSTSCKAAMVVQTTCKYCRKYFGCNLDGHLKSFYLHQ